MYKMAQNKSVIALLLFRDRELYRSDNRLVTIELSDSDGHGKF